MSDFGDHQEEIAVWQQRLQASLTDPNGWLSLVSLTWLEEGDNRCGTAENMAVKLPCGAPDWAATYQLKNGQVNCKMEEVEGLVSTSADECDMQYSSFKWQLIERGGKYGIRVRDTLLPARIRLRPRIFYPVDANMRVCAQVNTLSGTDSIRLRNVLDMEYAIQLVAIVRFELQGEQYELLALDGGPDDLFLILTDETTGELTYGGGRYLYCPRPDVNGQTIVDFNKLYNPPCNFTDYATCLLPPAENHIPLTLTVGEQIYGDH